MLNRKGVREGGREAGELRWVLKSSLNIERVGTSKKLNRSEIDHP